MTPLRITNGKLEIVTLRHTTKIIELLEKRTVLATSGDRTMSVVWAMRSMH